MPRTAHVPTIESTWALRLDVLAVMRPFARALSRGALTREVTLPPFAMRWRRDRGLFLAVECTITIQPGGDHGALRVRYTPPNRDYGPDHPPQDYVIPLDTTCPPFGGRQWWFRCPHTGRRCRILFLPAGGRSFACRQVYRLGYRSRQTTLADRKQRVIGKLCQRLGGEWSVSACDLPPKPKWMRWATYRRIEAKAWAADEVASDAMLPALLRLVARLERGKRQGA